MKDKFLSFLHSKLDLLLHDDLLNISDIQKKARYLAQYRYQDSNYNKFARKYLFAAVCEYDSFLLKKLNLKVKELCS